MISSGNLRRIAILSILLLAFFLRAYRLDSQALRGDEAATVLYAALPVSGLWELSRVTDPHPPLYYLMLHPWQWLFGEEAWMMRFAGVCASTLAVAALYRLAQLTLCTPAISLLAAGLLAVNPLQIWLAQDVRSYPFFTLLGLLSSWALWQALSPQKRAGEQGSREEKERLTKYTTRNTPSKFTLHPSSFTPWLLYLLPTVACLYTHYYTVFLIAFQGIFVLLNIKKFRRKKWPWLASQVAAGLLILPGLQLATNFLGEAAGGINKIPAQDILRLASTALLTGFTLNSAWGLWVSILLLPIWIIGIISLLRRDFTTGTFWTLFFAIPTLGVIALSIDRPFFKERFLIQAQPAFELLLAAGFFALWRGRVKNTQYAVRNTPHALRLTQILALATLALLLTTNYLSTSNYHTDPAYAKAPPWQLYHNHVNKKKRPGDVMLTNFPEAAVSYYSPNGLPFYVVPAERDRPVEFRLEQTAQIANAYERIWFLPMLRQGFDEQGDVLNWLNRHADRVEQIFFPVYNLNLYLSPPAIDKMMVKQPVKFAHGVNLRGFQILDKKGNSRLITEAAGPPLLAGKAGDEFTLSLYWQADGPTEAPYTVFVHLIAADGFNRVGQDNQPVWGSYPTTTWPAGEQVTDKYTLTIPPGTPPGDHRLRIGWYQADTQERVSMLNDAGHPLADHLILDAVVRVK